MDLGGMHVRGDNSTRGGIELGASHDATSPLWRTHRARRRFGVYALFSLAMSAPSSFCATSSVRSGAVTGDGPVTDNGMGQPQPRLRCRFMPRRVRQW